MPMSMSTDQSTPKRTEKNIRKASSGAAAVASGAPKAATPASTKPAVHLPKRKLESEWRCIPPLSPPKAIVQCWMGSRRYHPPTLQVGAILLALEHHGTPFCFSPRNEQETPEMCWLGREELQDQGTSPQLSLCNPCTARTFGQPAAVEASCCWQSSFEIVPSAKHWPNDIHHPLRGI